MDTISAATATTAGAPGGPTAAENVQDGSAGRAISSDFETFLRMLTVQLENQDPLNPVQSTDFAVQLATFSGVEQQVRTNELLEDMVSREALGGLAQIAGWVGLEARAPAAARFDGTPVEVFAEVPDTADQATLIVRDAANAVVSRMAIPAETATVRWDGTDALGTPVDPGLYSFEIETRAAGDFVDLEPAQVYARVTEARMEAGAPALVFEGGEIVPADQIGALRSPQAR